MLTDADGCIREQVVRSIEAPARRHHYATNRMHLLPVAFDRAQLIDTLHVLVPAGMLTTGKHAEV